jgi:hypothetical protein
MTNEFADIVPVQKIFKLVGIDGGIYGHLIIYLRERLH